MKSNIDLSLLEKERVFRKGKKVNSIKISESKISQYKELKILK